MNEQQKKIKSTEAWLGLAVNKSIKENTSIQNILFTNFSGSRAEAFAIGIAEQRKVDICVLKSLAYLAPNNILDAVSNLTRNDILFLDRIDEALFTTERLKSFLAEIERIRDSVTIFYSVSNIQLLPEGLNQLWTKTILIDEYISAMSEISIPIGINVIESDGYVKLGFVTTTRYSFQANETGVIASKKSQNKKSVVMPKVRLSEIIGTDSFTSSDSPLTIALGLDSDLKPIVADLNMLGHLLIAGSARITNYSSTRAENSNFLDVCLLSFLFKADPCQFRLILIDPTKFEFFNYDNVPHLLAPLTHHPDEIGHAVNWCVAEMERRYKMMSMLGVRNLAGYNLKIRDAERAGEKIPHPFSLTRDDPEPLTEMPSLILCINELPEVVEFLFKHYKEEAKSNEEYISDESAYMKAGAIMNSILKRGSNAGIHILASVGYPLQNKNVETICEKFAARAIFKLSGDDSKSLLNTHDANSLTGNGDMFFQVMGVADRPLIQSPIVSDDELLRTLNYLRANGETNYIEGILDSSYDVRNGPVYADQNLVEADPLYDEAVGVVLTMQRASISMVQRQLRIGYNRATRLIEDMERAGIVSEMQSNGNRDILVKMDSSRT